MRVKAIRRRKKKAIGKTNLQASRAGREERVCTWAVGGKRDEVRESKGSCRSLFKYVSIQLFLGILVCLYRDDNLFFADDNDDDD